MMRLDKCQGHTGGTWKSQVQIQKYCPQVSEEVWGQAINEKLCLLQSTLYSSQLQEPIAFT